MAKEAQKKKKPEPSAKKPEKKRERKIKKEKVPKKRGKIKLAPKIEKEPEVKEEKTLGRYFEATGRRKTAVARIRLFTRGEKTFLINGKPFSVYFPNLELRQIAESALEKMKCLERFRILAKVKGGGLNSQAEAVRHGISRALVLFNSDFKKRLKRAGYLTRDSRMRERKKFGLKRARRAPQWAKR